MTTLNLLTTIKAPKNVVFDLARNIDVHQNSASSTHEKAIDGTTSGLININETVTWRGRHFGLYLTHKSQITTMNLYDNFVDEMQAGHFKSFRHEHIFHYQNETTTMIDKLQYETPFFVFGQIFDFLFLKKHLNKFLLQRNQVLKSLAEKQPFDK